MSLLLSAAATIAAATIATAACAATSATYTVAGAATRTIGDIIANVATAG